MAHRQIKTFYGQQIGSKASKRPQNKTNDESDMIFNDQMVDGAGLAHSGSSSVGAARTGISIGGPVTATSGWSTSLANDHNNRD